MEHRHPKKEEIQFQNQSHRVFINFGVKKTETEIEKESLCHNNISKQIAVPLKSDKILMRYVRLRSHFFEMGILKQY